MVKPVRESRLATVPTVREALPPWAAVAVIGRTPWLEMNMPQGNVKAELVAQQRLVSPALAS